MDDASPRRPRRLRSFSFDPRRGLSPSVSADDAPSGAAAFEPVRETRYAWLYAIGGLLLALGAPAGALLIRAGFGPSTIAEEWSQHGFFYLYTLVGTCLVFTAAGYAVGASADSLTRERDRFQELSERDDLTGLLNARVFWERYRRAIDKVTRFGEPISLLVMDVDHLKRVNDQEGHRFGNKVLQAVSQAISRSKRSDDVAARWGGDEFVILMPGGSTESAVRVAENVLQNLRTQPVHTNRSERVVSVTIGIATAEADQNAQGLFDRADAALYAGKRKGGNQYQIYDGSRKR